MKKIIILSALLSLSISPVNSGFAYAPMTTGEGATYAIYSITGVWHDTGYLDINTQTPILPNRRISYSEYDCPPFSSGWTGYQHPVGTPDTPVNLSSSLRSTFGQADGVFYFGEGVSENLTPMYPPYATITWNPIPGETFTVTSSIYAGCGDTTVVGTETWTYKTITCGINWAHFTDVCRTSLSESNGYKYNYVYMKAGYVTVGNQSCYWGGGFVDLWFVNSKAGTPTARPGWRYWALPCG